jgi:nitronate monooxygenase
MWPDRRVLDLFAIDIPILQAPMAGASDAELAIAIAKAGGLGALPAGMLDGEQLRAQVEQFRAGAKDKPLNLNFLAHRMPSPSNAREHAWRERLKPYYLEFGIDPAAPVAGAARRPFDASACAIVEEIKPAVVSFHYGLPEKELMARVKAAGCKIICSATTVEEARFLDANGCDAIIAQGLEAGGHRGMFLSMDVTTQVGLFALLPQVVDAVKAAALTLGAAAVQIGTAFLFCPEAKILPPHRAALRTARDDSTIVTNVFSGRLARGLVNRAIRELGPISDIVPEFPLASGALAPLHAKAQAQGSGDFSPMFAGQAAALGHELLAGQLVRKLAAEALDLLPQRPSQAAPRLSR